MLNVAERDELLAKLTKEQLHFVSEKMLRSRRSHFANVLARQKGAVIPDSASYEDIEALLNEWVYVGYIDAGVVTPDLRCECGRPLRYQHIVEHKQNGTVLKFGINHLQEHLGIDAKIVQDILNGFEAIDLELDELLIKKQNGWINADHIPPEATFMSLPEEIQAHLDHDLPLLNVQLRKLRQFVNEQIFRPAREEIQRPRAKRVEQVGWDLFNEPPEPEKSVVVTDYLSEKIKMAIIKYLKSGIQSVRIICEKLLESDGASDSRYLTGKPKIYYPVCKYIERFVKSGECIFLGGDHVDRKFKWESEHVV